MNSDHNADVSRIDWIPVAEGTGAHLDHRPFPATRFVRAIVRVEGTFRYLRDCLPEIAAEFAAEWAGLLPVPRAAAAARVERAPIVASGDPLPLRLPAALLGEVLDRGQAAFVGREASGGLRWLAVPWRRAAEGSVENDRDGAVLVLAGERLRPQVVPQAIAAVRLLRACCDICEERSRDRRRLTQLQGGSEAERALVGESPAIAALRTMIDRVAATDLPALVVGEPGTGKTLVCRLLHHRGGRAAFPFVSVDCADPRPGSEFDGADAAVADSARRTPFSFFFAEAFEAAHGGTVVLERIDELSLDAQEALLELMEGLGGRVAGNSQRSPFDVRVIATTSGDLSAAVRAERFREQLSYRLNVLTLELPALRERAEDVLPLAEHFLETFCAQAHRRPLRIGPEAARRLEEHLWPGNVHELRILMKGLARLSAGEEVDADDPLFTAIVQRRDGQGFSEEAGLTEATRRFQQEYIRRAIRRGGGNMSEAARLLGLHRANLYRKMRQLGMQDAEATQQPGVDARPTSSLGR